MKVHHRHKGGGAAAGEFQNSLSDFKNNGNFLIDGKLSSAQLDGSGRSGVFPMAAAMSAALARFFFAAAAVCVVTHVCLSTAAAGRAGGRAVT